MKTTTKFALAGLAAALLVSGSALADTSDLVPVDNHHGSVTYLYRPASKTTTVAFVGRNTRFGTTTQTTVTRRTEAPTQTTREFTTGNGTVRYAAPAE